MNDFEIIDEYNVGIANVKIVRYSNNTYQYLVEEVLSKDFEEKISRNVDIILNSIPYDSNFDELTLSRIVSEVLNVSGDDLVKFIYALRKELKYKKFQVLVDDPFIEDISVAGVGPIWVRHSKVLRIDPEVDYIPTNIVLSDFDEVLKYINLFAEKANKIVSKSSPILDANLPDIDGGHRIHLVLNEVSLGRPEITIRKKKSYNALSIKSLIDDEVLPEAIAKYLNTVIRARGSIIIVGPPGSGKTTLLRALLYEFIPPTWKIVIIEDTPEIDPLPQSNWIRYIVPTTLSTTNYLDQFTLSKAALRSSVNKYIVVGETRGAEAQVLVQAMNMGLGGLTTFHGGNVKEAIIRLTGPPINLSNHQISMFWSFVTVNYVFSDKTVKRAVVSVDEPIYDVETDNVILNNIYSFGDDVSFEELIKKSIRLKNVGFLPNYQLNYVE
ncbi:MAG: type II/IV secretion system ATPase subunit [Sulfolobales archaeon]